MDIARNLGKDFLNKQIDQFNKECITGKGSGITLTNNEIKDIMKVVESLENRKILLKGTARKITSQEGGFLNFLQSLMTAGLPLIRIVKSLEESGLLIKGISGAIKNEIKERKGGFVGLLLGRLAASILGNPSAGRRIIRVGERVFGAGKNF